MLASLNLRCELGLMSLMGRRPAAALAVIVIVIGFPLGEPTRAARHAITLVNPERPIEEVWELQSFGEPTRYRIREIDGRPAIEAVGQASAAGLFRDLRFAVSEHPIVEWTWRVDRLPEGGDLRSKEADDVGASLFFLFGRPGLFRPEPPTLAYAWTSAATPAGSVVVSPRHPGTLRTIVLQSGAENLGRWISERRNLIEDYRLAFGEEPPERLEMIALWSDSDQTGESVHAFYGRMLALRQP